MIVAAQSEVLRQPVVIGKITAIVVTHRVRAIGCVHPVHLPSIPLTVDGLPGMRDFCMLYLTISDMQNDQYEIWMRRLCNTFSTSGTSLVDVMARQAQIVMHAPQPSSRHTTACFNRCPYIQCAGSFELCVARSDSVQCVGIAIANLRPTINLPVDAHCHAIAIDATKTRVPCLHPVKPDITASVDAIEYLTLAAKLEEWM